MIAVITTAASVKLLANSMRRSRRFFSSLCIGVHLLVVSKVDTIVGAHLLRIFLLDTVRYFEIVLDSVI